FAGGGGRFVGERLEDHLMEARGEPVLKNGRHREIAQRAAIVSPRGGLALLEETLGGPSVLLVRPRLGGLDVRGVLAHVLLLGSNRQDLPERLELLVLLAGFGVKIRQRPQRLDVLGRQLERTLVESDGLRLLSECAGGARRYREGPRRVGI